MHRSIITVMTSLWVLLFATIVNSRAETVIHTERSAYRNISVIDNSNTRCIRFSSKLKADQSCIYLNNPVSLVFDCNKMMMGALYLRPNPQKILVIGLGGGTLPSALIRVLPESEMRIVEIDPAVVRVAKKYFNFQPTSKIQITEEDGRVFVKRAIKRGEKYDLIVLDAYGDNYIPEHMLTEQFLKEVKKILAPDGVLAANTYSTSKIYDRESVTYESVYGNLFNIKKFLSTSRVILTKLNNLPSQEVLKENAKALEEKMRPLGVEASWLLPLFSTERDWDEDARILTDQFSAIVNWQQ